jgi:hypothetical protein
MVERKLDQRENTPKMDRTVQLNVDMPYSVRQAVKRKALDDDTTAKAYVLKLILADLNSKSPVPTQVETPTALAVVKGAHARRKKP